MNTTRRKFLQLGSVLAGTRLAGQITPGQAADLKKVTVRLAFGYNGHRSPYLLGVDKGFYKDEGLDVEVLQGKGVTSSMQLVASGQDTFNVDDPPSLMLGVAQGMPLRQILQLYQVSPNALISWKDEHISKPSDLMGKTVASLQGDTTTTMLYAMLAKNGVDRGKVHIVTSDGGTRNQTFLAKRAQAITGFYNDSYIGLQAITDGKLDEFTYADFGIDTMGDGICARQDTITNSPDVVRGFVRGTLRAYKYALEHPEESIKSLIKRAPTLKADVELKKLKATGRLLHSDDTKKNGIGFSSKARWEATQTLMSKYGGLSKTVNDVSVYYTNRFLASS